jgi:transposase InsO family protein
VLRTNNGGKFTAAEFAAYCADEGIQRHYSAPYSPQQNGVVECRNQTVVAAARAPQVARHADGLLGRGRDDRRTPAQPLAD